MKIQINNFRNIKEINFEGKRIRISGKNKEGKTSIMRSIERVLFGTIGGYKRGTLPIKIGETDCYVYAKIDGIEYERTSENLETTIPVWLRPIMYANLLEQEPRYIKETLAEVFLKDIINKEFKEYDQGSLDKTLRLIRNMYVKFNKEYELIKTKILFINNEIEQIEKTLISEEEYKEMYANMLEAQTKEGGTTVKELEIKKEFFNKEIIALESDIQQLIDKKASLLNEYNNKKDEYNKVNNDKVCPLCGSKINNLDELTSTIVASINLIKDKGEQLIVSIANKKKRIKILNEKLDKISDSIKHIILTEDGINESSKGLFDKVIKYRSKLEQHEKFKVQQSELVKKMITMNDDPIIKAYAAIGPNGSLNNKLSDIVSNILKGYEIILYETSARSSQDKAVFKICKDGIPYRLFSRSEKLLTNILLSIAIMKEATINLPLLIDDLEMFTTVNKKDLIKLLDNSGLEYITNEVKSSPLTIKTQ